MQRRPLIFSIFTAAMFLSNFYQKANAVIAPSLSADLDLSSAQLGLMSSVFFATFAAVQIPLGIGLDRWGPRWVTSSMMMIGGVGSFLFAAAPSLTWLTLGRGLMGIGMASILMGSMKAFSKWYSPARFATMTGLLMGIASLGSLSAATPLAWLNAQVGWRAVFVGMGLVTIVAAVIMAVFGRNAPPDDEQKVAAPVAPAQGGLGDVLRDKRFWLMVPLSMVAVGSYGGFQGLWIGPYLFDNYRLGDIEIGNLILLMAVGGTVGSLSSGWLADRFDLVRVVLIAALVFVLAQVVLALNPAIFAVGGVLLLFGYSGAFNVLVLSHVRRLFPDEMTGQALTAINLSMFVGIFLVQWLSGVVIGQFPVTGGGVYEPQAYTVVLFVMAAFCLGAVAIYSRFLRDAISKLD